jgi:hypothetical protein
MEPIQHNLPSGLAGAAFVQSSELESFADVLRRQVDHDVQIMGGGAADIMAYRREKDGHKITFLLNRSEKHRKVSAILKDDPDAAIYDHETGTYTRLDEKQTGAKTLTQLRFQPNQSYFIVSGVRDASPAAKTDTEPVPIALSKVSVHVPFNVASVYHFAFAPHTPDTQRPTPDFDVRTEPRHMPVNWAPECPDWTEWAGTYEAEVEINAPTEGIRLVLDRDFAACEVYVNDTRVDLTPCCDQHTQHSTLNTQPPFLTDFFDVQADVGGLLQQGMNRLRIVSPTKLSEPLRLVGQFHVEMRGTRVLINKAVDPNPYALELAYPFYSGTVSYTATFDLDREFGSLILNLRDVRDAAEVFLNGQPAGKRLWAPYRFEIAGLAKPGRNEIRIDVRNNMTNLIQGNPRPLGLRSAPVLEGFAVKEQT